MLENTFLSLSGHGCLHEVRCHQNDESYITLKVIQESNDSQADEIWVTCQFDRSRFPFLTKLDHSLVKNKSIILKFDASYSGFQQCYAGMSAIDPCYIVQLRGDLLNIHEYYIEGVKALSLYQHGRKNNKILHSLCA